MTRRYGILFGLAMALLTGCQAGPHPGLAALKVTARAEPKQGVPMQSSEVGVYDRPASSHYGGGGGAFEKVDYASLANIVVWIQPAGATPTTMPAGAPPGPPVRIDVGDKPSGDDKVIGAGVGQQLIFVNRTARAMTIYSVSDGNDFDLGRVPPGGERNYVVHSPGLIEVLTDSSDQPLARVYAAPNSHVAVTHSGGEVTFNDLPPGQYRVLSWHPRLPGSEATVDLRPNQVQSMTITVGVNALPKEYPK
ncbi:MAG TPA: carboxypeptidase-like regulatory domain-containing protein [Tepidisphaeraceae bacterium]|jgi:hypothetical protein